MTTQTRQTQTTGLMSKLIRCTKAVALALATFAMAGAAFADGNWTIVTNTVLDANKEVDTLSFSANVVLDLNGHSLTAQSIEYNTDSNKGYVLRNFVTSTNNSTHILTDYTLKASDRVVAKVNYPSTSGSAQMLFGARTLDGSTTSKAFIFLLSSSANKVIVYHGSKSPSADNAIAANKDYIVTVNGSDRTFTTEYAGSGSGNSGSGSWDASSGFTGDTATFGEFAIFGGRTYKTSDSSTSITSPSKCKLYWLKVYDKNNNLKRCFVPAIDRYNGNAAGLYDIVTRKFFKPNGSPLQVGTSSTIDSAIGESTTISRLMTNSSETEATLTVNVPDGVITSNRLVNIAGNLKFVKTGAGTFGATCANQTYNGGTEVNGGVLRCDVAGSNNPFGTGGVTVGASGTLDMNGQTGYNTTLITMAGGTLINSGANVNYDKLALGNVRLEANSRFALSNQYAFAAYNGSSYGETVLDLGGHTLDVALSGGGSLYFAKCSMSNGTINVTSDDNRLLTFNRADSIAPNSDVNITVSEGARIYPLMNMKGVNNFTLRGGCYDNNNATGVVEVNGTFKTATNAFCNVKLMDGATLDLSENSGVFDVASTLSGRGLTFANSGTITVYTGNREIAADVQLVEWTAKPTCDFALSCDGATPAERQLELAVQDDGLYIRNAAVPVYAKFEGGVWKFYTSGGEEIPGWQGGVTDAMEVRITSYEEYAAIAALQSPVGPSKFVVSSSFALPTGEGVADMSSGGLVFEFAPGITIDVKGRSLKLPLAQMAEGEPFTVTSSVAGGKLIVDVPEGTSAANNVMALTGKLQLVKTGDGTFIAAKAEQTFTGGTEVDGGVLKCGISGSLHPFGSGNLVKNGSFDEGTVPASQNSGNYSTSEVAEFENPHWTASPENCVGLSKANTGWVNSANDVGTYALYFRTYANGSDAYVEQTVQIDKPGTYRLKFDYMAYSADSSRRGATNHVTLVHNSITNIAYDVENITNTGKITVEVTGEVSEAGEYTLRIQQDAGGKILATAVDNVELFCEEAEVTVKAGGTLDMNGQTGYNKTLIIMEGGTLVNSGSGVNYNNLALGNVRLTANSTFALSNNYAIAANDGGTYGETFLDLGGNTLDVSLSGSGNLYLSNCFMTNGAINVSSDNNRLITFFGAPSRAVNVDITVEDGVRFYPSVRVYPNVETFVGGIRNFTLNGGCYDFTNALGVVEVVGTFKCTTNIFCNVKLMDGAKFDLSDETGSFNVESGATAARKRYVSFENGGTINVEIGDRVVEIDDKLITWATQPEGCTFNLLSNGVVHAGFKVAPTASGLDVVSAAEGQPELDGVNTTIELNGTTATVNWTLTSAGGNAADVYVVSTDVQSGAVVTNATALAQGDNATGSVTIENLWSAGGFGIKVIAQCGKFIDIVSAELSATGTASVPSKPTLTPDEEHHQIGASGTVTLGSGTTVAWLEYGPTNTSYSTKIDLTLNDGAWTATIPYDDALWTVGKVYARVAVSNDVTGGVFGTVAWKNTSAAASATFTTAGRTVTQEKFNSKTGKVTLAFGGSAVAAQTVVVVWGSTDNGGNINDWPYNQRAILGTVNAGDTTATFTLPAEALAVGTNYRFFLGVDAEKPYDAEVKWIQPAQLGAYIETEFTPSSQPRFEMKINLTDNQVTSGKDYGHIVHTGKRYQGDVWLFCNISGNIGAKRYGYGYFGPFSTDDDLKLVGDWRNDYKAAALKVNNETLDVNNFHSNLTEAPSDHVRFWSGYLSSGDGKTFGYSTCRLYYSKWWDSGKSKLEAHFIPVRKDGKYGLYDIVSGKVSMNSGASGTSFTNGATVTEYVPVTFATVQTAVSDSRQVKKRGAIMGIK